MSFLSMCCSAGMNTSVSQLQPKKKKQDGGGGCCAFCAAALVVVPCCAFLGAMVGDKPEELVDMAGETAGNVADAVGN